VPRVAQPLFVVTYRPKPQMQAAVLGGMMPLLRNAFPPALMAHVQGLQAAGPAGAAALAALLGSVPSLAGMFGPPPPPGGAAAGGGFSGFAPFAFPGAAMAPFAPGMPLNGRRDAPPRARAACVRARASLPDVLRMCAAGDGARAEAPQRLAATESAAAEAAA
jgi:hypothetical protein